MNPAYDYKKYAILYVDDETVALTMFAQAFSDRFRVLTANNIEEGWKLFEAHQDEIAIVVSDQRMPGGTGTELLARVKKTRPHVLRILATAYSDLSAAVDAINNGSIYKYITKPWDNVMVEVMFLRGLEFFILQKERDQLARERFSSMHRLMIKERVISFGLIAAGLQHHCRNSMLAIEMFLSLVPEQLEEEQVDLNRLNDPFFWQTFYEYAEEQVERITTLLTDLEEVSMPANSEYNDKVWLGEVITQVQQKSRKKLIDHGIQIENKVLDDLMLTVDRQKFSRIFELLIADEILALPPNSTIEFQAKLFEKQGTDIPWIEITITDDGPALSMEELSSIFDPFYVRNDSMEQFGLHLMACFFLVYHHGGVIRAESRSEKGNTFVLEFPTEVPPPSQRDLSQEFMAQVLLNDGLWEKLLKEM